MFRKLSLLTLAGCLLLGCVATSARASTSDEAEFVRLINEARAQHGERALATYGDLTTFARHHSEQMAARHSIYHSSNLSTISGWRSIGENVGSGTSVRSLHDAFMNSPAHRANILYAPYNQVGVGVATSDGKIYVTEIFVVRGSTSSAPHTSVRPRVRIGTAIPPHHHHAAPAVVAPLTGVRVVEMLSALASFDEPVASSRVHS
jgi:hypothetical protein